MRPSTHWALATICLLLHFKIRGSYSASTNTCDFTACEVNFVQQKKRENATERLCQIAVDTALCMAPLTCSSLSPGGLFKVQVAEYQKGVCGDGPSVPTSPPTPLFPTQLANCTPAGLASSVSDNQSSNLPLPHVQLEPINASCLWRSSKDNLHCSAFGYSHFRSFGSSRVQTCFVPGSWFLLKHKYVTVEFVASTSKPEKGIPYTRIEKVNITLFAHDCFRQRSYVAIAGFPLPTNFSDGSSETGVLRPSDESTVTIQAPWINTTIIVRSSQDLLALTLHMPVDLSVDGGEGICIDGCGQHIALQVSSYVDRWLKKCRDASNSALLSCVLYSNMFNSFLEIRNSSYIDICHLELLLTGSSEMLPLFRAIAYDAKLLPNTQPWDLSILKSLPRSLINGRDPPTKESPSVGLDNQTASTVVTTGEGLFLTSSASGNPFQMALSPDLLLFVAMFYFTLS